MHLHNIDGVIVPFDNKWKNIAIGLSGGADSALLAYMLSAILECGKADPGKVMIV